MLNDPNDKRTAPICVCDWKKGYYNDTYNPDACRRDKCDAGMERKRNGTCGPCITGFAQLERSYDQCRHVDDM